METKQRVTPGLDNLNLGPRIPIKHCLCGTETKNCRLMITLSDGKRECSIKIIADHVLRNGINLSKG